MNLNLEQNKTKSLTTAEIALLKNVNLGTIIYNTTTSAFMIYDGSTFKTISLI